MPKFRIFRGHIDFDMMHLEHMRETIKKGRELLATPPPDAFAGHKTQEPFPSEERPRADVQILIGGKRQPPKSD